MSCNTDLRRFLLTETRLSIRSTAITTVLETCAGTLFWNPTGTPDIESMYRLLLDEFGNDVDVDDGCFSWKMTLNAGIFRII